IKRAALIWSIAVGLYQGQITDERLVGPEFKQLLASVPSEYPSSMSGCSGSGKTSQALITTKDDFACNNSCVPSADLFKTSLGKIADKIVGGLLGTAMSKKSKEIVEGAITLLESGKDLKEASDSMDPDDAVSVITNVSSAAGTIAGVAGVLEMAGAAEIAAVVGAFQVGWEIGSALNLVIECAQWKAAHCGPDGGSGGTTPDGSAGTGGTAGTDSGVGGTDSGAGGSVDSGGDDSADVSSGCTPDETRCKGIDAIETCDTNGQWQETYQCPFACLQGGYCGGECKPGIETKCDGFNVVKCDSLGQWDAGTPCPFFCSGTDCAGECQDGTARCDGLQPQTCSGYAWTDNGTACVHDCLEGSCHNQGATCGDPCSTPVDCPKDMVCCQCFYEPPHCQTLGGGSLCQCCP
ncbi:MAG: hypothetical protein WCW31_06145, partial [Patescibacteria group bacterium]